MRNSTRIAPPNKEKPFFLPKKNYVPKIQPAGFLKNLSECDDPDMNHSLDLHNTSVIPVPCVKTEAEIERAWEYGQIMGHRR